MGTYVLVHERRGTQEKSLEPVATIIRAEEFTLSMPLQSKGTGQVTRSLSD